MANVGGARSLSPSAGAILSGNRLCSVLTVVPANGEWLKASPFAKTVAHGSNSDTSAVPEMDDIV
jgi:hypothetical protein